MNTGLRKHGFSFNAEKYNLRQQKLSSLDAQLWAQPVQTLNYWTLFDWTLNTARLNTARLDTHSAQLKTARLDNWILYDWTLHQTLRHYTIGHRTTGHCMIGHSPDQIIVLCRIRYKTTKFLKCMVEGRELTVRTDHKSFTYVLAQKQIRQSFTVIFITTQFYKPIF